MQLESLYLTKQHPAYRIAREWLASPGETTANGLRYIETAAAIERALSHVRPSRLVLFVSGFWRSGTTWLQEYVAESCRARTLAEPLSPLVGHREQDLILAGLHDLNLREGFIPGPTPPGALLWRYLDGAISGVVQDPYLLGSRRSLTESFRNLVVMKDVRMQFNLRSLHQLYGAPVLHIRRHPCAVVSSLVAGKWRWDFEELSLLALLDHLKDILEERFGVRQTDLARFDTDRFSRIAAYWALTERVATLELDGSAWGAIIHYEDSVEHPPGVLNMLAEKFGIMSVDGADYRADSASTGREARGTHILSRKHAWRARLGAQQVERISEVVRALNPEAASALEWR